MVFGIERLKFNILDKMGDGLKPVIVEAVTPIQDGVNDNSAKVAAPENKLASLREIMAEHAKKNEAAPVVSPVLEIPTINVEKPEVTDWIPVGDAAAIVVKDVAEIKLPDLSSNRNDVPTKAEIIPEKEIIPETGISTNFESEKKKISSTRREHVEEFLNEAHLLSVCGNEIEELLATRKLNQKNAESTISEKNENLSEAIDIKAAIEILLSNQDEIQKPKLLKAIESYNIFLSGIEEDIKNLNFENTKTDRELLVKINGQKAKIDKLTKLIGSQEIFESIRIFVKGSARIAEKEINNFYNEKDAQTEPSKERVDVSEVLAATLRMIRKDPNGSRELLGQEIIGVFQRVVLEMYSNNDTK